MFRVEGLVPGLGFRVYKGLCHNSGLTNTLLIKGIHRATLELVPWVWGDTDTTAAKYLHVVEISPWYRCMHACMHACMHGYMYVGM